MTELLFALGMVLGLAVGAVEGYRLGLAHPRPERKPITPASAVATAIPAPPEPAEIFAAARRADEQLRIRLEHPHVMDPADPTDVIL